MTFKKIDHLEFEASLRKEIGEDVYEALFKEHCMTYATLHDIWGKPMIYFDIDSWNGQEYQVEYSKPYLSIRWYDPNPEGGYYAIHISTKAGKSVDSMFLEVSDKFVDDWFTKPYQLLMQGVVEKK